MSMIIEYAKELGAEFHENENGWTWRCGLRSSVDQHGVILHSQQDAASHFLGCSDGVKAARNYIKFQVVKARTEKGK